LNKNPAAAGPEFREATMQTHVLTGFEAAPEIRTGPLPSRKEKRVETRSQGSPLGGDQTPSGDALEVVLIRTRRGEDELGRPVFGLGLSRLRLLAALDGQSTLNALASADPELVRQRLVRDAARLVAFGLAKQIKGELPREYLVAAMNLTVRIPRSAVMVHLENEKLAPAAAGAGALPQLAAAAGARPTTVLRPVQSQKSAGSASARRPPSTGNAGRLVAALVIAAAVVAAVLYVGRI
jgi:hypothetical protein